MKLIVCVDDDLGMLFNGRRQSRDRELTKRILEKTKGENIFMSPYSAQLFDGLDDTSCVVSSENYLEEAKENDFCFVERESLAGIEEKSKKIILYRWNRNYPADTYFPIDLSDWSLIERLEFTGYSHEKITEEVYIK